MLPFIGPDSMPWMTMAEMMEVMEKAWVVEGKKGSGDSRAAHAAFFFGFRRGQPASAYLGQMAYYLTRYRS